MALTYDIKAELLSGYVGQEHFSMRAVSGGGRGRTTGKADFSLMSRLSTTEKDERLSRRGGTLPDGTYACEYRASDPTFHECVHLRLLTPVDQLILSKLGGHRGLNSFYIHGRGAHGSDGCIVPMDGPAIRHRLNQAIRDNPNTTLEVFGGIYGLPAMRGTSVVPSNYA